MKIILAGVIENISTRMDNTVKVTFGIQEMDSSNMGQLFELRNKFVKCLFSDSQITDPEAAAIDSASLVGSKKRSQSQRLRAVLFRVFEQTGYQIDFDGWYQNELEKIIEHYKAKLNQEAA